MIVFAVVVVTTVVANMFWSLLHFVVVAAAIHFAPDKINNLAPKMRKKKKPTERNNGEEGKE